MISAKTRVVVKQALLPFVQTGLITKEEREEIESIDTLEKINKNI